MTTIERITDLERRVEELTQRSCKQDPSTQHDDFCDSVAACASADQRRIAELEERLTEVTERLQGVMETHQLGDGS